MDNSVSVPVATRTLIAGGYQITGAQRQPFHIELYQKRHLLAHNEGIVDSQYIKKSGDLSYKEGQRIVISGKDVDSLVSSMEKLSNGIKEACDSV